MRMAYSNGQAVGSVVGCGTAGKTEQDSYHFLDLLFFSTAITDNGLFYLKRCIFCDIQIEIGGG